MRISLRSPHFWSTASSGLAIALLLAWISNQFSGLDGWLSFLSVTLITWGVCLAVLRCLQSEDPPAWMNGLTLAAALFRLTAGVLWFTLLPVAGHDTPVQNAGYVMSDAFARDAAAWKIASSEAPLTVAFRETEFGNFRGADQYGGLLFLSAGVYRYLGSDTHQPLLMVVLSAGLSALLVPLTWAFSRRLLDERTAKWAAWIAAFFPEAVLLGSSQMREAFLMPLAAATFYGLALYRSEDRPGARTGILWMALSLLIMLPLSPPFTGITVVLLAIVGLGIDRWRVFRNWRLWLALSGTAVLVIAVLWLGWGQIAPRLHAGEFETPFAMAARWLELSARWQAQQTAGASGWLQKIFESTPEWFNLPFLVGYGVARPLLPAQLAAFSVPIWWAIGVWRALGWTLLLLPLLYAPVQLFTSPYRRDLRAGLILAVWVAILIAAFWGGGDQWDNPRYRVVFISLQAALAAQVVTTQQIQPDPWMRRGLIVLGTTLVWFLFWYLRRYTVFDQIFGWTVVDLFKLLAAGVLTGILIAVWDALKDRPLPVE